MSLRLVILAGGLGSRHGGNKPFTSFGGSTLIETVLDRLAPQVSEIAIGAGAYGSPLQKRLEALGRPLIFDRNFPGLGPLSGILSALEYAETVGEAAILTVPCDMPELPFDLVDRLRLAPQRPVVHFQGQRDYPLCALWQVSLRPALTEALRAAQPLGGLAVMRFLSTQSVTQIPVRNEQDFININRPSQT